MRIDGDGFGRYFRCEPFFGPTQLGTSVAFLTDSLRAEVVVAGCGEERSHRVGAQHFSLKDVFSDILAAYNASSIPYCRFASSFTYAKLGGATSSVVANRVFRLKRLLLYF